MEVLNTTQQVILGRKQIQSTSKSEDDKAIRQLLKNISNKIDFNQYTKILDERIRISQKFSAISDFHDELQKFKDQLQDKELLLDIKTLFDALKMPHSVLPKDFVFNAVYEAVETALNEEYHAFFNNDERLLETLIDLHNTQQCYSGHQDKCTINDKTYKLSSISVSNYIDLFNTGKSSDCTPQKNKEIINSLMKNLCVGLPINSGIRTQHSFKYNKQMKLVPDPTGGNHAVVINGVQKINNSYYFTFRNSWGPKQEGISLMPLQNSCLGFSYYFLTHLKETRKNELISEADIVTNKATARQLRQLQQSRIKEGLIVIKK